MILSNQEIRDAIDRELFPEKYTPTAIVSRAMADYVDHLAATGWNGTVEPFKIIRYFTKGARP